MINGKHLLKYTLPVSLIAFCWVTMRTVLSFTGESTTRYGFPFPWYSVDGISSMAYVIAIGPLLADLGVYVLLTHFVISLLLPQSLVAAGSGKLSALVLWLGACASLAFTMMAISIDPHFVAWALDTYYGDNSQRSYGIQFGLGK